MHKKPLSGQEALLLAGALQLNSHGVAEQKWEPSRMKGWRDALGPERPRSTPGLGEQLCVCICRVLWDLVKCRMKGSRGMLPS